MQNGKLMTQPMVLSQNGQTVFNTYQSSIQGQIQGHAMAYLPMQIQQGQQVQQYSTQGTMIQNQPVLKFQTVSKYANAAKPINTQGKIHVAQQEKVKYLIKGRK